MESMVTELSAALDSTLPVNLVVLFGSTARGARRVDSDVDLGVWWSDDTSDERRLLVTNQLERIAGRALDVVDLQNAPPQLRFEIAREGILLFERSTGSWAEFRARASIDWWDFRPIAEIMNAGALRRLRQRVGDGPR